MKRCAACSTTKSDDKFYTFKGTPWGNCKVCHRVSSRKHQLMKTYGLSVEDYEGMVKKQNGVCAICLTPGHSNRRQKYPLYVDHNHETGRVRGLLCQTCNTMLGQLENNRHLLIKMDKYLASQA